MNRIWQKLWGIISDIKLWKDLDFCLASPLLLSLPLSPSLCFCLSFSVSTYHPTCLLSDPLLRGSQLPCCDLPYGEARKCVQPLSTWYQQRPREWAWKQILPEPGFEMTTALADSLTQSLEGPWARGSQLDHPWVPDPKKLWGYKCLLLQPTRFWGNLFCSIDNKYKAFFIYVGYRLFVIYMYYKYLPPLLALLLIIDSFDKGKFLIFHVFPFIMFFFYDECWCVLFKKI